MNENKSKWEHLTDQKLLASELELEKTRLEIKKLQAETLILKKPFKKSEVIIALITLAITLLVYGYLYVNGFFDAKLASLELRQENLKKENEDLLENVQKSKTTLLSLQNDIASYKLKNASLGNSLDSLKKIGTKQQEDIMEYSVIIKRQKDTLVLYETLIRMNKKINDSLVMIIGKKDEVYGKTMGMAGKREGDTQANASRRIQECLNRYNRLKEAYERHTQTKWLD